MYASTFRFGMSLGRAILFATIASCGLLTGCAHYATPGAAADMRVFGLSKEMQTDASVANTLAKRPLAKLPTAIAIVRVQASGYQSETAQGLGHGAYSIITQRDIDNMDVNIDELQHKMPMVTGLVPINRLLLSEDLRSDLELRQAAAALHADMLLIYTLDTTFHVEDVAAPLSVITLGLSPNQVAHVSSTASAVLIDTRNGYVYGIAEATETQNQLASGWTSEAAVDQTRRRVESKAFGKLADNLQLTWTDVVSNLTHVEAAAGTDTR
jgi:hypothetical protein